MELRQRASVVCVNHGHLLTVKLQDPSSGEIAHYLPGGAIEPGETPAAAAKRETLEETGYEVEVDAGTERQLRYVFHWDGAPRPCLSYFYRAHLKWPDAQPAPVHDASYHRGVEWLPLTEVRTRFGYHAAILKEIEEILAVLKDDAKPSHPTSFAEFWPDYVRAHRHPVNRALHVFGSLLAIACVVATAITGRVGFLILAPIAGYACAWLGHFFIERNRPATFRHPLWSLLGDAKMLALSLRGRMAAEVKRIG